MFIAALFTKTKCGSNPRVHWQMNRLMYIHTVEYYSALKRKKILTHAVTWVNFEDIVLNEMI